MSDKGFDPCECIWSHELAMQRLLSILRQTQAYCTDNECLNLSRLPGPRNGLPSSDFFLMCMTFGIIALMYALRPRSLRQERAEGSKTRNNGGGPNGDPPAPPPTAD
ncbi:small integral membrane protein 14 isoform X1 [Cephus cinctus]|uniref:Small integral membrane protein 14 n=1 Tax=Cephus cinctus TaxID=211228 RepID=A0AAJ7BU45_CEPCN|nr:small integral membrane protein 14 isoform X1 [Cephus cinctus]XP_015594321.1 small integral membrane protein 14 isoform X1 [Cephus cinctus]